MNYYPICVLNFIMEPEAVENLTFKKEAALQNDAPNGTDPDVVENVVAVPVLVVVPRMNSVRIHTVRITVADSTPGTREGKEVLEKDNVQVNFY